MRATLLLIALAGPAVSQEPDHVAEAGGLRVVHAWTAATSGPEALVFLEIENRGDAPVTLTGGTAGESPVELVGFSLRDGEEAWTPLPGVTLDAGDELHLEPQVLALRLSGLEEPLVEGGHFDLTVAFDDVTLPIEVAVEPEGATAHSHAGHQHE